MATKKEIQEQVLREYAAYERYAFRQVERVKRLVEQAEGAGLPVQAIMPQCGHGQEVEAHVYGVFLSRLQRNWVRQGDVLFIPLKDDRGEEELRLHDYLDDLPVPGAGSHVIRRGRLNYAGEDEIYIPPDGTDVIHSSHATVKLAGGRWRVYISDAGD